MRTVHQVRGFCVLDEHEHAEELIQTCQPEVVEEVEGIPEETHDRQVFEYSFKEVEHMSSTLPAKGIPDKGMLRIRCPIRGARVEGTDQARPL